jgi:hypothetical protein
VHFDDTSVVKSWLQPAAYGFVAVDSDVEALLLAPIRDRQTKPEAVS